MNKYQNIKTNPAWIGEYYIPFLASWELRKGDKNKDDTYTSYKLEGDTQWLIGPGLDRYRLKLNNPNPTNNPIISNPTTPQFNGIKYEDPNKDNINIFYKYNKEADEINENKNPYLVTKNDEKSVNYCILELLCELYKKYDSLKKIGSKFEKTYPTYDDYTKAGLLDLMYNAGPKYFQKGNSKSIISIFEYDQYEIRTKKRREVEKLFYNQISGFKNGSKEGLYDGLRNRREAELDLILNKRYKPNT